jgi:hypothetical protein
VDILGDRDGRGGPCPAVVVLSSAQSLLQDVAF